MLENAACNWAKDAVANDNKHGSGFAPVVREGVDISVVRALYEVVGSEFAQVVSQLITSVLLWCQAVCLDDSLMNVGGAGSVELC